MSTVLVRPFAPAQGASTQNIAVTSSSQSYALSPAGIGYRSIRVVNTGTIPIFIAFGTSTVTASLSTSMPIQPASVELFTLDQDVTHIAVIASGTGPALYTTIGQGI